MWPFKKAIPQPPQPIRYCEDCKWFRPAEQNFDMANRNRFAKCFCPELGIADNRKFPELLIARGVAAEVPYCSTTRTDYDFKKLQKCGSKAKWFEPKDAP